MPEEPGDWAWEYLLLGLICAYSAHWFWTDRKQQQRLEAAAAERRALVERMRVAAREDWTLPMLAEYNGRDPGRPILLAVRGRVYNVWRGREFYGEAGDYHCFAGKDATRMLAKELLEPEPTDEHGRLPALTAYEKMMLRDWEGTFMFKYDDVGSLANAEEHVRAAEEGTVLIASGTEQPC